MTDQSSPEAVSAILNELRDSVRRHQPYGEETTADGEQGARWRQIDLLLDRLRRSYQVNPHLPIAWPEWPRGLIPKATAVAQKIIRRFLRWYINPIVDQQNNYNRIMLQTVTELRAHLGAHLKELDEKSADQGRGLETLKARANRLERRTALAPTANPTVPGEALAVTTPPAGGYGGVDYFLLELEYRGSSADIRGRQQVYLDDFAGCQTVLDIGCGRGEFVALLRERGVDARGIDLDPDMVAHCQANGLPVEQADAIAYLAGLDDRSLDGIFMAQVVEHLEPAILVQLLNGAWQKLRERGVLVAETINPACLYALVNHYLIDPSHVQPVHPNLLKFLAESAGFVDVELRYQSPMPDGVRLERLEPSPDDPGRAETQNRNIDRLNDILFGFQDYALIARQSAQDPSDQDG